MLPTVIPLSYYRHSVATLMAAGFKANPLITLTKFRLIERSANDRRESHTNTVMPIRTRTYMDKSARPKFNNN